RRGITGRGRDGDYSPPPAQIPACGFPAPGSCRRSNVTGIRGLAAHAVPVRRQATLVTCLVRHGVRGMPCHLPSLQPGPFPPPPPPPFITGLFGRFIGTTSPSDSSPVPRQLRLLDFLSRPGIAVATAGQARSPRFRRDPFARDGVFDHGRASTPRIAAPHILPSATVTASASTDFGFSRLNSPPHAIAVYASRRSSPSAPQHSLPSARYGLLGPDFHRLDRASFAWRTTVTVMHRNAMCSPTPSKSTGRILPQQDCAARIFCSRAPYS